MIETTPLPKEELELFKQLKDLNVIFDVGARVDTDYIDLWPDSQHHLFEPNPEFFDELVKRVNDKHNVRVNKFGLGDKEETRGYQEGLQSFLGSGSCPENGTADLMSPIETLDFYIHNFDIK